jgi:hypothetical protein
MEDLRAVQIADIELDVGAGRIDTVTCAVLPAPFACLPVRGFRGEEMKCSRRTP